MRSDTVSNLLVVVDRHEIAVQQLLAMALVWLAQPFVVFLAQLVDERLIVTVQKK